MNFTLDLFNATESDSYTLSLMYENWFSVVASADSPPFADASAGAGFNLILFEPDFEPDPIAIAKNETVLSVQATSLDAPVIADDALSETLLFDFVLPTAGQVPGGGGESARLGQQLFVGGLAFIETPEPASFFLFALD